MNLNDDVVQRELLFGIFISNKHETAFPAKTARNNQNAYNIDSNYLLYYSYLVLIQITIQNIFKSSISSLSLLLAFFACFLAFFGILNLFLRLLSLLATLKFTLYTAALKFVNLKVNYRAVLKFVNILVPILSHNREIQIKS